MRPTNTVAAIGIGVPMRGSQAQADFCITDNNSLVLQVKDDAINVDICIGRATKSRINFIIECLERLKLHASDD